MLTSAIKTLFNTSSGHDPLENHRENSPFEVITQDALKEELAKYVEAIIEEDRAKIKLLNQQNETSTALTGKENDQESNMVLYLSMLEKMLIRASVKSALVSSQTKVMRTDV